MGKGFEEVGAIKAISICRTFFGCLGVKVVFVIAEKDFRDEELFNTQQVLKSKGVWVIIASKRKGIHRGMLGGKAESQISLGEISVSSFDAVVFVGGTGSVQYFNDPDAINLAKSFFGAGKVVAAICMAPSILANASLLNGKKATVYPSEKDNLLSKGAAYKGSDLEVDGKIITASGPQAAKKFGEAIAKALGR